MVAKKRKKTPDVELKVRNLGDLCNEDKKKKVCGSSNCGGFGYFLGFLGAAIYYISTASGFWMGVLGFLKAIIWPLFLVLDLLKFLGA